MVDKVSSCAMPHQSATGSLGYLTGDMAGIGGVIKQRPEDFVVHEMPLYEASGDGEHLMLLVQRANRTTTEVMRQLARVFRVSKRALGYAGMKDKQAVTRQYFTVHLPGKQLQEEGLARVKDVDSLEILEVDRHRNKLRRGHLKGNRFSIKIRGIDASAVLAAKRIVDVLSQAGIANYVGPQRFGYRQTNHELGRLLLLGEWQEMVDLMLGRPSEADQAATRAGREAYERGDYAQALECWPRMLRHDRQVLDVLRQGKTPRQAVMAIDRAQRFFLVSALQSYLFNGVVDRRLGDDGLGRLLEGDLAWIHQSRAVFAVDRETAALENGDGGRMGSFEISPSGPMWGPDMTRAQAVPGEMELAVLSEAGLDAEQLCGGEQGFATGVRRPLRVPVIDPELNSGADEYGPYVQLKFALHRGCFATMVLREVMKVPLTATDTGPGQDID